MSLWMGIVSNQLTFVRERDIAFVRRNTPGPYLYAYPWSAGFGTKYADPATLPASSAYGVAFSPSGNDIAVANNGTPPINVYPWSAGFGTKYANPATLPASQGRGVAFSPN